MELKALMLEGKLWGYYVKSQVKGDLYIPIDLWLKYGDVIKNPMVYNCSVSELNSVVHLKDCRVIKGVVNSYNRYLENKQGLVSKKSKEVVLNSRMPMGVELRSVDISPNGITYDVRLQYLNRGMLDVFRSYVCKNDYAGYLTDCLNDCGNSLVMDLPILDTDFKDVGLLKFFRAYNVKVFIDNSKGLIVNYANREGVKFKDILKRGTLEKSISSYGLNTVYINQGLYDFYNPRGGSVVSNYEGYIDNLLRLVKNKVIDWS